MGIIKEFNELPLYVKSIIMTLLITMPFWFIILFLYFPSLLQNDWYKIVGFCFVPCFVWYFLTLIGAFIAIHSIQIIGNEFSNSIIFWIIIAFDTIVYLIIISVLLILFRIKFEYFISILFGYKIITLFFIKPYINFFKKQLNK